MKKKYKNFMKFDGYNVWVPEIKTIRDEYGRRKPASFSDPIHSQSIKQCLSYIDFTCIKLSAIRFGRNSLSEKYKGNITPRYRMLSYYENIDCITIFADDEFVAINHRKMSDYDK